MAEKSASPPISSSFLNQIEWYVKSSYPAILVQTQEYERVIPELEYLCDKTLLGKVQFYTWNLLDGFVHKRKPIADESSDPLEALKMLRANKIPEKSVIVFKDFHFHMAGPESIEAIRQLIDICKSTNRFMIFLSPVPEVPRELDKLIVLVEHQLPTKAELEIVLREGLEYSSKVTEKMKKEELDQVLDAARGLTAFEAENSFALAYARNKKIDVETIHQQKKQAIQKSQMLEFYETGEKMEHVGGLENFKNWLIQRKLAFSEKARKYGLPAPKGILAVGIPGCGKSLTAKATANAWELPLLRFDVGRVFAGLVGASEANMRNAIKVAEAMAPCVLWIDEIEKAFAGISSSGSTDSGVTARVFGNLLTWMQEHKETVFVYATANDVTKLPPELLRKGRFDEIFFIDLPNEEERESIWKIHLTRKGRNPEKFEKGMKDLVEKSADFTGAEIEQALVSAMYSAFYKDSEVTDFHCMKALMETVPLSRQMAEQVDKMRSWAKNRAVAATPVKEEAHKARKAM